MSVVTEEQRGWIPETYYKNIKFDVWPRGNMLQVAPVDPEKAGLKEPSVVNINTDGGKVGFYLVLAVSPGYESPHRPGQVTIDFDRGQIVLIEKKHIITETFTAAKVDFVSANYVLGVVRKR